MFHSLEDINNEFGILFLVQYITYEKQILDIFNLTQIDPNHFDLKEQPRV